MDRIAALTSVLILLAASAAAVDFDVDVAGKSGDALFVPNHSTGEDVHKFNASLENPSSVGCGYYFRGEFERGNKTERRYSNAYRLWPGETVEAEIKYAPVNYTGEVNANIDLLYCDTVKNVSDYSFEISNPVFNNTYEAETLEVSESSVAANLSVKNAELIPVQTPAYWRVGAAEVERFKTEISYKPTLFMNKSLSFAVVQNGSIKGKVEIDLNEPKPTLKEKLWDQRFKISAGLVAVLVFTNLYSLRRKILPEAVLKKLAEIEPNRSIKK